MRLEVLAPAGGEVVDAEHLVAALEQHLGDVRADLAARARDQCFHFFNSA
jgi:hypothetical protein